MTQITEINEKKSAEITMISGCLAIITSILIAVILIMAYSHIKNCDEGTMLAITIFGIIAGGVALALSPVISRCKPRQVILALAFFVLLPALLLVSDYFRTMGFNEIPWGSWTIIIIFCGTTTLFVSYIQPYFCQLMGNIRPVYPLTVIPMTVMMLSAGSGVFMEILRTLAEGNLFMNVWFSILAGVYLLALTCLVYLAIMGFIGIRRYVVMISLEAGYEK
jgi:hypothetical protein